MTLPNAPTATALTPANPWAMVPPLGNLDAYITAVNRLPMLIGQHEVGESTSDARADLTKVERGQRWRFVSHCRFTPFDRLSVSGFVVAASR